MFDDLRRRYVDLAQPRLGSAFGAVVVLRTPQADHAIDQTALDFRADRG